MEDLYTNAIITDNAFRSRDGRFDEQKKKYGKRHQDKVNRLLQIVLMDTAGKSLLLSARTRKNRLLSTG